jgi:CHAT domain
MKKTKILIISANPKNTSRLRLDEKVREIEEGLRRSKLWEKFSIKSAWALRPKDLRRTLLDEQPHIVHFSGHGSPDGLVLENLIGEAFVVSPEALEGLFNLFRDNLECILLNACYSEAQAAAIAKRIPHVIGMEKEITDEAALEFSIGFYDALGAGRSINEAFNFGCNAIQLLEHLHGHPPILLCRAENRSATYIEENANYSYKFRAECQPDVDELRQMLGIKIDKVTIVNTSPFPDVEVEIETRLSLESLRNAMRQVVGGHVMVQTVAHAGEYTGERNYEL